MEIINKPLFYVGQPAIKRVTSEEKHADSQMDPESLIHLMDLFVSIAGNLACHVWLYFPPKLIHIDQTRAQLSPI